MDKKFLGWIGFEPTTPSYMILRETAEFQSELAAEGHVAFATFTAAGEKVSSMIGMVFSSEPVDDAEAQEAFDEFIKEDEGYEEDEEEGEEDA